MNLKLILDSGNMKWCNIEVSYKVTYICRSSAQKKIQPYMSLCFILDILDSPGPSLMSQVFYLKVLSKINKNVKCTQKLFHESS